MKAPASLPIFGDAYLADTQHLTLEEHGAYFKLLLCAWRTSACELPLDDKRIATMLGVSAGKWGKLKPAVLAFWTLTATGWHQKRLTKERKFVDEKRAKNSLAAEARWEPKALETNDGDDANANANAMPLSPTHLTEEKKEETPLIGREGLRLVCEVIAGFVGLTRQAERQADRDRIVAEWNAMASANALPLVSKLTDARRVSLDARIAEHGREAFTEAIKRIAASPMCRGENGRGWKANFDFLLQPSSFLKLMEGNYDGNADHGNSGRLGGGNKPHAAQRRNPAMDMLRDAIGGLDGLAGSPEADTGAPGGYRGTRLALSSGQLG